MSTHLDDLATSVGGLAQEVFQWAESTFPDRTDHSMYLKIYEEIGEVIKSDGHPDEVADLFILILDYARRKDINITASVRAKLDHMQKNYKWSMVNGVMHHAK